MPIEVEDQDHFDELLEDHEVVVADFWAEWCGPCKAIAPKYEELSEDRDYPFLKVEIDNFPDLAQDLSVTSVPTFIRFEGGEEVDRKIGSDADELKELL